MKMLNTNTGISAGRQSGFTLIEIAIVLVIIGLLLGGVLKGQELITTARVHALNNTVDGITAAWFSFQDRYRAYPGDYSTAQASINLPGVTKGGDGNGLVDTDFRNCSTPGFILLQRAISPEAIQIQAHQRLRLMNMAAIQPYVRKMVLVRAW